MQLIAYCREKGIDADQLARAIRVSQRTAYRYLNGERIPPRTVMRRLVAFCGGNVTANDIYETLPAKRVERTRRGENR